MGGNRSTKATKGGKYMNPTDQARKEERKKQLKKHKKQREQVREAVIKNKNPNSVLEELSKLDDLEFDTETECPYADRVMSEKRQRLRSTYFKILEYYKNSGKMDTWKEYQDDFNSYEKERERKKSLYQAVLKAKNWSVDHIPLPDMPMPDASGFRIGPQAPIGLPPKKENKKINKSPPGPPPGPPPDKKKYRKRPTQIEAEASSRTGIGFSAPKESKTSNVQKSLLALAGQDEPDDEENPPPPPPGIPPLANRPKPVAQPVVPQAASQFQPRQTAMPQSHLQGQLISPVSYASAYAAPQYATNEISAAPQVYKAPSATKAVRGEAGATLSAAPQITKPKVATTMFVPSAVRSSKVQKPFAPRRNFNAAPTIENPGRGRPGQADKAYDKFMAEMAGLM